MLLTDYIYASAILPFCTTTQLFFMLYKIIWYSRVFSLSAKPASDYLLAANKKRF